MKPGPKPGTKTAQRRLERELSGNVLKGEIVGAIADLARELARTANSNPIIGLGLGVSLIDIGFRARILSLPAAVAFYAFVSASVAGDVIGNLSGILPFSSKSGSSDSIQPTANTLYYGSKEAVPSATPMKSKKTGYSPE